MGTAVGAALIGRSPELQRLRAALSDLREGRGGIVLLEGEAGTGKTRLLSDFLDEVSRHKNVICAAAAALDYAPAPYAVVRDLLASLDRALPKVLARDESLRAELAPIMHYRPDVGADGAEQRRLMDAAAEALQAYAGAAPVVAAIEDIHWIDRASSDVFAHLARAAARMRVLLILTYRTTEAAADEAPRQLLGNLARAASQSIVLRPLSGPDALLLVDDLAPPSLALLTRRMICQLAEGNPLLIVELTKYAAENPEKLLTSLPLSLQALVEERLDRFEAADVDVLRVAAAMGEFDPRTVAQIAGVPQSAVMTTLRKARDASIVGETGDTNAPFVFRHALIRRAITDRLLAMECRALHARIAEYLAPRAGEPGIDNRLAFHYWFAEDTANSGKFNLIAGDEAMRIGAYHDAARYFDRALAGRPLSEETLELHLRLARAYFATRANEAEPLLNALFAFCKSTGRRALAVEVGFDLSRQRYHMLKETAMIDAAHEALALCDETVPAAMIFELHSTLAWYHVHSRGLEAARKELELAEPLLGEASPEARIRYYETRATYDVHSGQLREWRSYFERALEELPLVSAGVALTRLSNMIALSLSSYIEDDAFIESLYVRAREIVAGGVTLSQWPHIQLQIAWHRYLHGRLVEARTALDDALCENIDVPIRMFWFARVGIVLAVRTMDPLLLHRCTRPGLLDAAFASKDPVVFGPVVASVVEQLHAEKRTSELATLLDQTIKRIEDAANNLPLLIAAARHSVPSGSHAVALMEKIAGKSRSGNAALLLARAYLARAGERVTLAREAAAAFMAIGWRLYEAEARELAGDDKTAAALYAQSGATADVERLRERDGKRLTRTESVLTKREWEIGSLVAEGKSNRAIAQQLVLSEKTVENHIASIFNKLNLRSRTEIAAHVARETAAGV